MALEAATPGLMMEGAVVLGEIASKGERLPDFHNKTVAVGLFNG